MNVCLWKKSASRHILGTWYRGDPFLSYLAFWCSEICFGLLLMQGNIECLRWWRLPQVLLLWYWYQFVDQVSTAPSPIDPVLTVQPYHCYIFFSLKNTFKNYFINYHNIIHLSFVRRTRQTLKPNPSSCYLLIDKSGKIH